MADEDDGRVDVDEAEQGGVITITAGEAIGRKLRSRLKERESELEEIVAAHDLARAEVTTLRKHVEVLEQKLLEAENQTGRATVALVNVRQAANEFLIQRERS